MGMPRSSVLRVVEMQVNPLGPVQPQLHIPMLAIQALKREWLPELPGCREPSLTTIGEAMLLMLSTWCLSKACFLPTTVGGM